MDASLRRKRNALTAVLQPARMGAMVVLLSVSAAFGISFDAPVSFGSPVQGWARAAADINDDGYPDLVAQLNNANGGSLGWYKSNSGASFTWNMIAATAPNGMTFASGALTTGDMDNDGDMDIVGIAHTGEWDDENAVSTIYWFENPCWTIRQLGTHPQFIKEIQLADLNNDGRVDLATMSFGGSSTSGTPGKLRIFRQNSPASWTLAKELTGTDLPGMHEGMDIADIDGDGKKDIVPNGYWIRNPGGDLTGVWTVRSIDAKWHNQTGGWQRNATKVACADITGDGKAEVFICHSENTGYPLSWYTCQDPVNGTWTEHVIASNWPAAQNMQIADMNSDGYPDVVSGTNANHALAGSSPKFSVWLNNGSNDFTENPIDTGGSYNVVAADADKDGDIDLFTTRGHASTSYLFFRNLTNIPASVLSLSDWTYKQVDNSRTKWGDYASPDWAAYLGLGFGDVNDDRKIDMVSGRYVYANPGGDMTEMWNRSDFGVNCDALFVLDVDNDAYADVIASAGDRILWLEAINAAATSWSSTVIDNAFPPTSHGGTQGYKVADLICGGNAKPEFVITGESECFMYQIPDTPSAGNWPRVRIASGSDHNDVGVGDIDGDGKSDIALALGTSFPSVRWCKNPGTFTANWTSYTIGSMDYKYSDCWEIADMNNDGRKDIIVSAEYWESVVNDVPVYWFECPADPTQNNWTRHTITTGYTANSMDVADMDNDNDFDVIIGEHRGDKRLRIFENNGAGSFTARTVDAGKENHAGARVIDLDLDGDREIISIAWDAYQNLHLWCNDATQSGVQNVAMPVISPNGGTHTGSVEVTITCTTPDAAIYYTTDGSAPDEISTGYSAPFQISQTLVLRARAYKSGMNASGIAEAAFVIQQDETGPALTSVTTGGNPNRVTVVFDESVDEITAETASNYTIDHEITISSATLDADQQTVILTTSTFASGVTYTLNVNNVEDLHGNAITAGTEHTFQFITVQLSEGLIACYDLNEISGTTVTDCSGNDHDGTLNGGQWSAGHIDNAVSLDGVNDYINLGTLDISGSALTLACWFYMDDFDNEWGRLISKATGIYEDDHYWMLSTDENGGGYKLRFRLRTNNSTTTLIASSGNISLNTWHHAVARYDGASMKLYLDGVEVGSTAKTGALNTSASVSAWLGDNPPAVGNSLDGMLDEVRLYNRALSETEIRSLASAPVQVSLKIWLQGPFDSGSSEMNTALKTAGNLPLTSPYPEDPRRVESIPATITDWVLVQLRETGTGSALASKSAFLRNDGWIVADDGTTESISLNMPDDSYYVVVKHRNHIEIMSAVAMILE